MTYSPFTLRTFSGAAFVLGTAIAALPLVLKMGWAFIAAT
jgi:hypothetical protein